MPVTNPIRVFVVFAVLAVLGFAGAAWTAGAPLPVVLGTLASLAAGIAFAAAVDAGIDLHPSGRIRVGGRQ
jgi:hypothetical protein